MSAQLDPVLFVTEIIKELLQVDNGIESVVLFEPDDRLFKIRNGKDFFKVKINRDILDDFKGASELRTDEQFVNLKNIIEFNIYAQLLEQHALPNSFCISEKIINEKRSWANNGPYAIPRDDKFRDKMCGGLIKVQRYLEHKAKVSCLQSMKADLKLVNDLLASYCNGQHEIVASLQSMSFIKAALVCEIIDLEEENKKSINPEYLREYDDKIHSLLNIVRGTFINIKLPGFVKEYAVNIVNGDYNPRSLETDIVPFASNKTIFMARKFNEPESDRMKEIIETEFKKEDFKIVEGEVKDCGYVSEDILDKIKTSGFFIALITPLYELKKGKFSTSAWVLMEMGAAAAFERNIIPMADECVDSSEYSGKLPGDYQYELFSKTTFNSILKKVVGRIKNEYCKKCRIT